MALTQMTLYFIFSRYPAGNTQWDMTSRRSVAVDTNPVNTMSNKSSNQTCNRPMDVKWSRPSKEYLNFTEDDHVGGTFSSQQRSNENRWHLASGPYHYYGNHGDQWGYHVPPPPQGLYRGYGYYEEYIEYDNYASSVPAPPSRHPHEHPCRNGYFSCADEPRPPREFPYNRYHEHLTVEGYSWEDEGSVIPKPAFDKALPTQVTPPSRKRSSSEMTQEEEDVREDKADHRHDDSATFHHDSNLIWTLGPHDIVCGRGAPVTWNEGNRSFHDLIVARQAEYLCSKRSEKPEVATRIMELIKAKGGRFVRRVKNGCQGRFGWEEIEEKRAYEKVCQSLRERAPEVRRKMIASNNRTHPSLSFERAEEKENWSSMDIVRYQI